MQLVVNTTGAGMQSNSFCWFCQAVPKFPARWLYFLSPGYPWAGSSSPWV